MSALYFILCTALRHSNQAKSNSLQNDGLIIIGLTVSLLGALPLSLIGSVWNLVFLWLAHPNRNRRGISVCSHFHACFISIANGTRFGRTCDERYGFCHCSRDLDAFCRFGYLLERNNRNGPLEIFLRRFNEGEVEAADDSRLSCQRGNGRKISLLTSTNCEQNASFSFRPKVASAKTP